MKKEFEQIIDHVIWRSIKADYSLHATIDILRRGALYCEKVESTFSGVDED